MFCISIDYAETITNIQKTDKINQMPDDVIVINDSSQTNGHAINDGKIYTDKSKKKKKQKKSEKKQKNTITMTGKPSCGCGYGYYWHTKTYLNYCPNCHCWGTLGNKHKYGARFEQEISCFNCDSDFCICCGKEKYSWSHVYLRKE